MKSYSLAVFVCVATVLLVAPAVLGRPPHRQKRVSDQRLGELEALLALKKLRGKLVTVPVAFGQIDPNDFGRRRRSASHPSLPSSRLLERLLESLPQQQQQLDAEQAEQAVIDLSDVYDDAPQSASSDSEASSQHWASASWGRERPAHVFNRAEAD